MCQSVCIQILGYEHVLLFCVLVDMCGCWVFLQVLVKYEYGIGNGDLIS